MSLRRRAFLAATLALACDEKKDEQKSAPLASQGAWRGLAFEPTDTYPERQHAAVLVEGDGPVLVALHGRGEANRGREAGARGWRDDYHLERAHQRLKSPPLTQQDFLDFVSAERLAAINQSLAATPYRGLAVACPYTPALFDKSLAGAAGFGAFVVSTLLPRVRQELASRASVTAVGAAGIDGVSMGGRLALLVGLSQPTIFRAVGALQPAIGPADIPWLVDLAQKAVAAGVRLRLVTSTGDYFREAVEAYAAALARAGVAHDLLLTEGPHDYAWNRGPGAYEMLLWHDRVLRGQTPV